MDFFIYGDIWFLIFIFVHFLFRQGHISIMFFYCPSLSNCVKLLFLALRRFLFVYGNIFIIPAYFIIIGAYSPITLKSHLKEQSPSK